MSQLDRAAEEFEFLYDRLTDLRARLSELEEENDTMRLELARPAHRAASRVQRMLRR